MKLIVRILFLIVGTFCLLIFFPAWAIMMGVVSIALWSAKSEKRTLKEIMGEAVIDEYKDMLREFWEMGE